MFLVGVLAIVVAGLFLKDATHDWGRAALARTDALSTVSWVHGTWKTLLSVILLVVSGYIWGSQ